MSNRPAVVNSKRSTQFAFVTNQPMIPAPNETTPINAVTNEMMMLLIEPSNRRAGSRTNINGTIKPTNPKRTASNPTRFGLASAIPAAA